MKFYTTCALMVMTALLCSTPAMGAVKYLGGSPDIAAHIAGTSQFSAGEDATITVVLQNSGTYDVKYVNVGTLSPDDLSTTAKLVTVGLSSENAPIVIKTDPHNIGDIASPGTATASFTAKITSDATMGDYQLPLFIQYEYLSNDLANQQSDQIIQSRYTPVNLTIPLTIKIQPAVRIDVLSAEPSNLAVGTEGYVNLTIRNTGYDDGKQATVTILRNGNSAVIPTDNNVYIGDFPRNGTAICQYRVSVSGDAQQQTYPIDVEVTYKNSEGDSVTSATSTIGVPVGRKLGFAATSSPAVVTHGTSSSVTVEYQNQGTITASHAEARISATDPFTSTDNTAYLGDIPPGGKATAKYTISTPGSTSPGSYSLDTVVDYQDALDNSQTTDTFETPVTVVAQPGSAGLLKPAVTSILVVLVLIGAGYYLLIMRKRR